VKSDVSPTLVAWAKKSQTNNPIMRFIRYPCSVEKINENTLMRTRNIVSGFKRAQTNPRMVP
jgi:hypothetical protein